MLIKRLKLSGFKSFVEPSELRIEPGLTGIVGPNGCGKSNLLEAIRWVMGENSPKSMRSGGMEDVIFAGTQQRPARDFAEVVLQAEDDDGEELQVVRRIERGAGSAYRVNGQDVRAKDVALTFADAATGAHSPALVSQGKIAQVIAAKPAERRQMLEEAAGIAGLHVRRRDAESKLRQTEANLARLEDLMAGLDAQMASLKRQAKQAERYTKLSDAIRLAEARLVFSRWREAKAAADAARKEATAADEAVEAAQAAVSEAQKVQRVTAEDLAKAREEQADRRDDASAHGHRMASLTTQLEAAEERIADLDRQLARLAEDRKDADRMTRDAAEALTRLERDLSDVAERLAADEERRPALQSASEDAERAARSSELALAKATADLAGVEAEWRVVAAEIAQAEAAHARLADEAERRERQRAELKAQADEAETLASARQALDEARKAYAAGKDRLAALQDNKSALQLGRDVAASELSAARAEMAGVEREYEALERDRDQRQKQRDQRQGKALAIEGVRAEPGYEKAVAAVLGRDAKTPLGHAEGSQDGRFWTGRNTPGAVENALLSRIRDCPSELKARFALVHVADEDDERQLAPGEWLVTLNGALRRWDGLVVRGEGAAEAARLEADNRLSELEARLPALRQDFNDAETAHKDVERELSEVGRELVAAERTVAELSEEERSAIRRLDQAEAARERLEARLAELDAGEEDHVERLRAARSEIAEATAKRDALPDPQSSRDAREAAHATNDAARTRLQASLAALAAHDQALAVARERVAAQRSEQAGWKARAGDAARRLSETGSRAEELAEERAVLAAKPEGLLREIEQGEAVRDRLGKALADAEAALATAQDAAGNADRELASAGEALARAREARAGLAERAENQDARRIEMARIAGERFQTPPPLLPNKFGFEEDDIAGPARESEAMDQLVASRERIGPVNLVAAEELQRIEEERGAGGAEREELAEAVHRLRGSIGNLNREGRTRLKQAFEEVDRHFRRLFTRLFEGGQAHLALVDSDDPLEAGLEIFAQPPGKRLQSLTLLSGGEQALTAIALIFALFLTNPAPICVLDEVDAPLDDANIDRFCDLLDAMVRETKTRYLIVTHNAVTMSRMHRLFGVTMIEQGVSRLVSVDLGAAEELIAAE